MNAAGALDGLFTNPIGMSGSINVSHNRSRYHREESISVGSNLRIGKGVEYNGNNLHTRGLNIINEGDTVYNITGKIIKEAGKSTIKETSGSRGYGLSLAKGMLDSNGNINVFKDGNLTATAGVSRQKGESEAVYYSNNQDITKGKTTYNNNPEVKVIGVDVKTKEIEGSVKSLDIISVQDSVNGKSRGYSVNVGIGFGKHTNGEKVVNGPYISSVGAGYSKSDTTQKITRNVAEFSAESGILEVKDKVRQVGSLIDGGFTLNAKKYEHEDLEDINKSKSIGINVTVYPNVTYTVRDGKGKGVYTDGHTINGSGAVYKVGVSYAEVDKNREVVSTIGSNVKISQDMGDINRDVNNQIKEFEGKEVRGINVDLGTEYWLTEAGRGKTRDIIEGAGRTVKSIKKILTKTDSNGELEIVKNMEAESALRKMEQRGFVEGKDKKIERVAREIETKYGNLTKKGIKVRFYGEEDVDTSGLTEAQLRKLKADGIATTGDGYIWINKEKIKDGNTINFNKVVSHEITHQILGEDSEYEARYVESGMEEFLSEIKGNGYLKDGKIIDLLYSRLTDEDRARLNRYVLEDMQFKDLSGGAGDGYTVVNLKYQKLSAAVKNAALNDKYSKAYESTERYRKRLKEYADESNKKKRDKESEEEIEKEVSAIVEPEYKRKYKAIREDEEAEKKVKKIFKDPLGKEYINNLKEKELLQKMIDSDSDYKTVSYYFNMPGGMRAVVLENLRRQTEAYKRDSGKEMSKEEINRRMIAYMKHPGQLVSDINLRGMSLDTAIEFAQYQSYSKPTIEDPSTIYDLRNSIGKIENIQFKTEKEKRPVKILDTYRTPSGLEIVKVKDIQTGLTFTIGQGSNPDLFTWMKNKAISGGKDAIEKGRYELGNVAGDDDWYNNIFGNAQLPIDRVSQIEDILAKEVYLVKNSVELGAMAGISGLKTSASGITDIKYVISIVKKVGDMTKTITTPSQDYKEWQNRTYMSGVPSTPLQYVELRGYYENTIKEETNRLKKLGYSEEEAQMRAARSNIYGGHSLSYGAGTHAVSYTPNSQAIGVDPAPRQSMGPNTTGILIVNPKNGLLNETKKQDGIITSVFNFKVLGPRPFGSLMEGLNQNAERTKTIATYEAPEQFYMKEKNAYDSHRVNPMGDSTWYMTINAPIKPEKTKSKKK